MAKLTSEEFNNKYTEKIIDNDDLLIELMEDFSDSISNSEESELESIKNELETAKSNYIELQRKYKERFLNAVASKDEPEEKGLEEKEVIDVKEI